MFNLEAYLKLDYIDIRKNISKDIIAGVTEVLSDRPDSFLNQVIVPGVSMAGAKRLGQIQSNRMAEIYCTNLLQVSGLFDIYDSTVEGLDSVADTIKKTFRTMAQRMQDIYYAVYQPLGLGGIVYSEPGVRQIQRCIKKYEERLCRGKENRETVANKHIRIKGVGVLLLNAWYLEVIRADETVVRVMADPSPMTTLIQASLSKNILWHLDELVDERRELLAWNQTLRMAA